MKKRKKMETLKMCLSVRQNVTPCVSVCLSDIITNDICAARVCVVWNVCLRGVTANALIKNSNPPFTMSLSLHYCEAQDKKYTERA